ncbi:MAG: pilus assembly protein TadG-related protein, partial [Candidatus Fonsibacter sp.]
MKSHKSVSNGKIFIKSLNQRGSILILIIGLISIFVSIFIVVVNISSIYYQKQKLQSVIDQAVLLGTNYIDSNSYYNNSLLNVLNLDER